MKILNNLSNFFVLLFAFLIAFFEYTNNTNVVLWCAFGVLTFSITSWALQIDIQNRDSKEIYRINKLLQGHLTGGEFNKPIISVQFDELPTRSFRIKFSVINFGDFPLSNIHWEIFDTPSGKYNFYLDKVLNNRDSEKYTAFKHESEVYETIKGGLVTGSLPNLVSKMSKKIYTGFISPEESVVTYTINIFWNNQYYFSTYTLVINEQDEFQLANLHIVVNNEKVENLFDFFRNVPNEFFGLNGEIALNNELKFFKNKKRIPLPREEFFST